MEKNIQVPINDRSAGAGMSQQEKKFNISLNNQCLCLLDERFPEYLSAVIVLFCLTQSVYIMCNTENRDNLIVPRRMTPLLSLKKVGMQGFFALFH